MPSTNTGTLIYTELVQINNTTGHPTGVVKPNVVTDVDYIAPATDTDSCPLPV